MALFPWSPMTALLVTNNVEIEQNFDQAFDEAGLKNDLAVCNTAEQVIYELEAAKQTLHFPGLAFVDVTNKNPAGHEAAITLRKHPVFKIIPIILLVDNWDACSENFWLSHSIDLYATAPWSKKFIVDQVRLYEKYWDNISPVASNS